MADKPITVDKVDAFLQQKGEKVLAERIDVALRTKMDLVIRENLEKAVRRQAQDMVDERLEGAMGILLFERAKAVIESKKGVIIDKVEIALGEVLDLMISERLDRLGTVMDKIWRKRLGRSMENRLEDILENRVQQMIEFRLEQMVDRSIESRLEDKIERYVDLKVSRLNSEELDEELKTETHRHVEARVECIVSKHIDLMVAERVADAISKKGDASLTKKVEAIVAQIKMPERRGPAQSWRDFGVHSHSRSSRSASTAKTNKTDESDLANLRTNSGANLKRSVELASNQKQPDSKKAAQIQDFKSPPVDKSQKKKNERLPMSNAVSTTSFVSLAEDLGELRHMKFAESSDSLRNPSKTQPAQKVVQKKESPKTGNPGSVH